MQTLYVLLCIAIVIVVALLGVTSPIGFVAGVAGLVVAAAVIGVLR